MARSNFELDAYLSFPPTASQTFSRGAFPRVTHEHQPRRRKMEDCIAFDLDGLGVPYKSMPNKNERVAKE